MAPEDREIPISLRGIEIILRVLNTSLRDPSSIRQISSETGLSLRVAKNILLELQNLKQVKQVIEDGQVLSKWHLTDLGKQIAHALEDSSEKKEFSFIEKLLENVTIPKKIDVINTQIGTSHNANRRLIEQIQLDLSKIMGICFNSDQPMMAEKLGQLIKKIKAIYHSMAIFRSNPLAFFKLKKKGKSNSFSNKQKSEFLGEILLLNQILFNHISFIVNTVELMATQLEKNNFAIFHIQFRRISELIRILSYMIQKRTSIESYHHILSEFDLKKISKNIINTEIVNKFLPHTIPENQKQEIIQPLLISLIDQYISNTSNPHAYVPLISFFNLFNDQFQYADISLGDIEKNLNILAKQGLIVGVKSIKNGGKDKYRVVQLTNEDLMAEEIELIRYSLETKSFSITDVMEALNWDQEKTSNILTILTSNGLLRYTKSYLHGEKWYIVM